MPLKIFDALKKLLLIFVLEAWSKYWNVGIIWESTDFFIWKKYHKFWFMLVKKMVTLK